MGLIIVSYSVLWVANYHVWRTTALEDVEVKVMEKSKLRHSNSVLKLITVEPLAKDNLLYLPTFTIFITLSYF